MVQVWSSGVYSDFKTCDFLLYMENNKDKMIGSAIFTSNNSVTSKVVSKIEKFKCKDNTFVPSHTGSIIEKDDKLYLFDMKPMRAKLTLLKDYIRTTKDNYIIVIKNFQLNSFMFSENIKEYENEPYPFLSAIKSVFSKTPSKWRRHCSELHLRELQKQGILCDINPEITPDELFHLLTSNLSY